MRGASGSRSRWHRHGVIHPSAVGVVLFVLAAACWFAALLLDDTAMVAGALAVSVAWIISFMLAALQYAVFRPGTPLTPLSKRGTAAPHVTTWLRAVVPGRVLAEPQVEQLDQDGATIRRGGNALMDRRGWYRCSLLAVVWLDPFGLFVVRRMMPAAVETAVLPKVDHSELRRTLAADARVHGQSQTDSISGVREYVPGDAPRLISWRHTAHSGALMTRETSDDRRTVTLLVLDTRCDEATDEQVDAQVRQAIPIIGKGLGDNHRILITDGVNTASDARGAQRLLAASVALPNKAVAPKSRRAAGNTTRHGTEDDAETAGDPDQTSDGRRRRHDVARALADEVTTIASVRQEGVTVVLLTAQPQGVLAKALHDCLGFERLRVVTVSPDADARSLGDADGADAAEASEQEFHHFDVSKNGLPQQPKPSDQTSASSLAAPRRSSNAARRISIREISVVRRALRVVSLLVFFELAVESLTGVFSGAGYWAWFACAAFAVLSVEVNIPWKTALRGVSRFAAIAGVAMLAAVSMVVLRVHDLATVWLFDMPQPQPTSTNASAGAASARSSAWQVLQDCVGRGFDELNAQLPPIEVGQAGDLLLVLAVAVSVIVFRVMLMFRQTQPLFALLPLWLFVANGTLLGRQTPWWQMALLVFSFMLSLYLTFGRYMAPFTAMAASALSVVLVVSLTPSAVILAQRVPISIGGGGGLLSSNAINPMIDLKRSLQTGSDTTVLRYQADQRLYLRMTTLDSFNGDTWNFDKGLASDGGFYGSGVRLGGNGGGAPTTQRRIGGEITPLVLYMAVLAGAKGLKRHDAATAPLSALMSSAGIQIETLDSRFLPLPGTTLQLRGDVGAWLSYSDGTVYNRQDTTHKGMKYSADGIYLDPISDASGFSQIQQIQTVAAYLSSGQRGTASGSSASTGSTGSKLRRQSVGASTGAPTGQIASWPSVMSLISAADSRIHANFTALPGALPKNVTAILNAAKSAGVPTDGGNATSQIAAMRYLVNYFTAPGSGFKYSLNAPDGNGRGNMQVINDFLKTKSGYCVHYASALAVLGRAMGVPTRVVLGYNRGLGARGGDGAFAVAAKQLHSWVEAYIDGVGWVPFDVTPVSSDNGSATSANARAGSSGNAASPSRSGGSNSSTPTSGAPSSNSPTQSAQSTNSPGRSSRQTIHYAGGSFELPRWAQWGIPFVLAVVVVMMLLKLPSLLRARRRRQRMKVILEAAQAPRRDDLAEAAWLAAWDELCDTAWDVGVRWRRTDTEGMIVRRIIEWLQGSTVTHESLTDGGLPDSERSVSQIADQAVAIAFGGGSSGEEGGAGVALAVGDLGERLRSLCDAVAQPAEGNRSGTALARLCRRLFPASLRNRPR